MGLPAPAGSNAAYDLRSVLDALRCVEGPGRTRESLNDDFRILVQQYAHGCLSFVAVSPGRGCGHDFLSRFPQILGGDEIDSRLRQHISTLLDIGSLQSND